MKRNLFLLSILVTFVSISFPSTSGEMRRIIFGGTTAGRIFVRDYQILGNGRWDQLRELSFNSLGPVGTLASTRPNQQLKFSVFYTYEQNQEIKARNVRIDYEKFEIESDTALSGNFANFDLGVWRIQGGLTNRYRFSSTEQDHDVVSQKIRDTSGKPFKKKTQIFNNDEDFLPVSTSFDWWGTHTAQILFQRSTGDFFGDFRGITRSGKPQNDLVRYRFNSDVLNVSVSGRYTKDGSDSYVVATRDFKREGSTFKTSVSLNLFDAENHRPLDSRLVYNYRNVASDIQLSALALKTTILYEANDRDQPEDSRSYLIAGFPKGGKLLTYLQQYDRFSLIKDFNQVLVGPNDPIFQNSDHFYGYYAVGFFYMPEN